MRRKRFDRTAPAPTVMGRRLFCQWMAWSSFCAATAPFFSKNISAAETHPLVVGSVQNLASPWTFKEFTFDKEVETRGIRRTGSFPGIAIRLPDSSFYLASLICPHEGCLVEFEEPSLVCPCHRSVFDPIQEGKVLSGPSPRSLWKFKFIIDKETIVVLDVEPGGEMWSRAQGVLA